MIVACPHCGQPYEDGKPTMPPGCVCPPGEWDGEVSPVCAQYVGDGDQACRTCEHDRACHVSEISA